jgi:hypothetical protein
VKPGQIQENMRALVLTIVWSRMIDLPAGEFLVLAYGSEIGQILALHLD